MPQLEFIQIININYSNNNRYTQHNNLYYYTILKVSLIQDTFYKSIGIDLGKEKSCQRLYTFVVKDEETMEIIGDMNLTIPYHIAYEGNFSGVLTTKYYERT